MLGGPSINEAVLSDLANATGGSFKADQSAFGSMMRDLVEIPYKNGKITVQTGTVPLSRVPSASTVVTFTRPGQSLVDFEVSADNILTRIGKGLQRVSDLRTGDCEFDKHYFVHGKPEQVVKAIFNHAGLQQLLLAEPRARISIRSDNEGRLQTSAPANTWQLIIYSDGNTPDLQRLERLVNIIKGIVDRIDEVNSPQNLAERTLESLYSQSPHLRTNRNIEQAIRSQLTWAISKETQVCNEILQNAPDNMLTTCLRGRADCIREKSVQFEQEFEGRRGPPGWMKDPAKIVTAAYGRFVERLSAEDILKLFTTDTHLIMLGIREAVATESEICKQLLTAANAENARNALMGRVRPELVVQDAHGNFRERRLDTSRWGEWYPGLNTDSMTLREVYDTLPGFHASAVPEIVRKFENPTSPEALPGAVSLLRHDLIHILLGRGLLDQDEAFVIGFTMGSAREELRASDEHSMELAFSRLYSEPYRINEDKLEAFRLGVDMGRRNGIEKLYRFPIENLMDKTIGEVRDLLAIDKSKLIEAYKIERRLIPSTLETARLPIPFTRE